MGEFKAILAVRSSLNLVPSPFKLELTGLGSVSRVLAKPLTVRDAAIGAQLPGYLLDVTTEGESLDEAVVSSANVAEFLVSCLCFHTAVEIAQPEVLLVYETTEAVEERPFRQYSRHLPVAGRPAIVDVRAFLDMAISLSVANANVARAVRWFRKGLTSGDPIDQFFFFWHGLEAIDKTLAKSLGVAEAAQETVTRHCKLCDRDYEDVQPVKGGLKALYDREGVTAETRKAINTVRNGIAHGFKDIPGLTRDTLSLGPTMGRLLHRAICLSHGLDYGKSLDDDLRRVSPVKIGESVYVEGDLHSRDPHIMGIDGYYPYLSLRFKMDSQTEESWTARSSFTCHTSCEFEARAYGISGLGARLSVEDLQVTRAE
jgi:hypothetical protein